MTRHDHLKKKFPEQYALGVSQAELFWDAFGSVHTTDHAIIACESIPGMPLGHSDKEVAQRLGFKRTLRAKQVACKCQNCRNTLP